MNLLGKHNRLLYGRRDFIRKIGLSSAGLSLGSLSLSGCTSLVRETPALKKTYAPVLGESQVSFVKGSDRRQMIYDTLKPFKEQLQQAIADKQVLIKINCVVDSYPLIATHPDSVRGILDFLKPIPDRKIIIGESTASNKGTRLTFEQYGYLPLEKEYNVKLIDLNDEPTTYHWILDKDLFPVQIRVINTFLDPNIFVISVTRLKTHDCVVATLSLKNVVMGSPLMIPALKVNEKGKMHANGKGNNSPKMINVNLFLIAQRVRPDLAVLDGFEGVEGNGPTKGEPVDHRVALAGFDFLSVDRIGTELMGIPCEDIGYLQYCALAGLGQGDRSKIRIIGEDPKKYAIKYKLHENIDWQYTWKDDLQLIEKIRE